MTGKYEGNSSRHQGFIQKTFQNLGVLRIFQKNAQTLGICKVIAKNDGEWWTAQKPSKTNGFWYIFIQNLKKPKGKK